jgi:hypothetical protein
MAEKETIIVADWRGKTKRITRDEWAEVWVKKLECLDALAITRVDSEMLDAMADTVMQMAERHFDANRLMQKKAEGWVDD